MQELLAALQKIEQPGSFCTSGTIAPCFPGLEVSGIGPIGLPLTESQAREIIDHCAQAPFGRGEQTVVDTDVRRVWQLDPNQFQLKNPAWDGRIEGLVEHVKEQLGVGERPVSHELYKLLMYERGNFFIAHRDTEKIDNMFATLVVVLPSEHEGGELILQHDGELQTIAFGGENSRYQIQYAAFYADCEHEIKPVSSGYRCCLIYNLALAGSKQQPSAPKNSTHVEEVRRILCEWFEHNERNKLAFLLAHQYSQAGLSFDGLKNQDRAKAEILIQAARKADCEVHLALVTLWEEGSADGGYYGDDADDDDYDMDDVYERKLSVDDWQTLDGEDCAFDEIAIAEEEIVAENPLDDEPDDQEVHEYTGNAGASMERWYHHAALVVWPAHRHFFHLSQAGQKSTVPQLEAMVHGWIASGRSKEDPQWQRCRSFATEIIAQWSTSPLSFGKIDNGAKTLLDLVVRLDDLPLIKRFMKKILPQSFDGTEGAQIATLCEQYGWDAFQEELGLMAKHSKNGKIADFTRLFEHICCLEQQSDRDRLDVCKTLAEKIVTALIEWDADSTTPSWRKQNQEKRPEPVIALFKALSTIEETQLLNRVVDHFLGNKERYKVRSVLIPALNSLYGWTVDRKQAVSEPLMKLIDACIGELTAGTAAPPPEPTDWAQSIKLPCRCSYCGDLQAFIRAPDRREHRFKVRKDRRQHLHEQISKHVPDMTHVTERVGSPQTLVCTKTRDSYEKAKQQYETDLVLLAELESIQRGVDG